jgi:filamentous hemagglutinin
LNLPPEEARILKPVNRPQSKVDRADDTEFKILENFAQQYKFEPNVMGAINIFTEGPPCKSCTNVIQEQFLKIHPNMAARVFHGNGQIITYKDGAAVATYVDAINPKKWPSAPDMEYVPPKKKD